MRLLLIEDDRDLGEGLRLDLKRAGFAVDTACDGEQGEFLGATEDYDAAVLDLGLPKLPGIEVLRRWRTNGNLLPVIILTARDAWHEKVDGLNAGADDYMGKPFHVEELIARLRALVKRHHGLTSARVELCGVELDEERQCVVVDGQRTESLTAVEFRLLRYMMLHPGRILSKSRLNEHIYEYDSDPESNVIEVYVNRLRRKLGRDLITTRRGQGYVFGKEP